MRQRGRPTLAPRRAGPRPPPHLAHEAFTLPPSASPLYSSPHCKAQAYAIDNIVATVAHPEVTAELLDSWLSIYGDDIEPTVPSIQPIERIREDL